jgi:hypothetical protein
MARRIAVGLVALATALVCAAPAAASSYSVDDDRAQCPLAEFTDLNTAVLSVTQGDSLYICPGTYNVPGGAGSGGLLIQRNIDLIGAGANQVFIQPDPAGGPSIAAASPNLRDAIGNVITVRRASLQLFHVNISGLTVRAPNPSAPGNVTAVEGGIAMIDVIEGSISDVRVEDLVPAAGAGTAPYAAAPLNAVGDGIILGNTIEDTHDEITITDTVVDDFNHAGIVVDNRTLAGAAPVNKSRLVAIVDDTSVTGEEPVAGVSQNGIELWGSTAADNGASLTLSDSLVGGTGEIGGAVAGIFLFGGNVGASLVGGSPGEANDFSTNQFGIRNRNFANSADAATTLNAESNWFGALPGAQISNPPVDTTPTAASQPAAPPGPGPPTDALPSLEWDTAPSSGQSIEHGHVVPLAALAGDDFGVNKVEFFVGASSLGIAPNPPLDGDRVYNGMYTPTFADIGSSKTLSAVATDSAGQTQTVQVTINIVEDVTAPQTTIDGGPAEGSLTNDPTPLFLFSSDDPTATFTCKVDGAAFGPCSGDGQHVAGPLSDGQHTFAVRAGDPQGNVDGSPATRTFTVDTTPPQTKLKAKLKKKKLRKGKATFTFSAPGDPAATFQCSLDKAAFAPCTSPQKLKKLKKRKHTFEVRATDPAGNTDQSPAKKKFKVKKPKH